MITVRNFAVSFICLMTTSASFGAAAASSPLAGFNLDDQDPKALRDRLQAQTENLASQADEAEEPVDRDRLLAARRHIIKLLELDDFRLLREFPAVLTMAGLMNQIHTGQILGKAGRAVRQAEARTDRRVAMANEAVAAAKRQATTATKQAQREKARAFDSINRAQLDRNIAKRQAEEARKREVAQSRRADRAEQDTEQAKTDRREAQGRLQEIQTRLITSNLQLDEVQEQLDDLNDDYRTKCNEKIRLEERLRRQQQAFNLALAEQQVGSGEIVVAAAAVGSTLPIAGLAGAELAVTMGAVPYSEPFFLSVLLLGGGATAAVSKALADLRRHIFSNQLGI